VNPNAGAASRDGSSVIKICVVMPCYRARDNVLGVLAEVPPSVNRVFCVDDGCPENTGGLIEERCQDPRVTVLRHERNRGVGAATVTGYRAALAAGAEVVVKIDADGQMDPRAILNFVRPIIAGEYDYAKGNRFYRPEGLAAMPWTRLVGNAALSFLAKLSTGYWDVLDPNNGYTAVHAAVLRSIPLEKLAESYFFEADILFRLSTVRAAVADIAMDSVYRGESSSLRIHAVAAPFLLRHLANFLKRIVYAYFVRDFQVASIEWLLGPVLVAAGVVFGFRSWVVGAASGEPATAGTVMLAALPIIVGVQLLLSAVNFDVQNVPKRAVHPDLIRFEPRTTPASKWDT
jgi:dolichol-phosphate mannosyltransferase